SLALDDYDDIFSDFDPRPYSERALSDDFLAEAKKGARDKPSGGLELKLMLPKAKRREEDENTIRKRLREHFRKHYKILRAEKNSIIYKGVLFVLAGVLVMFFAALFFFEEAEYSFVDKFLLILLEPAGWFLFWEGLDMIVFESKKKNPDLSFYKKMVDCEINFIGY
ncbi:MAG: hypothetical protein QW227_00565, partial [Candidatus Aenigmatarchaeota archaeon]